MHTFWEICRLANKGDDLPNAIICNATPRLSEKIPLEIEQLLPINMGSESWRLDIKGLANVGGCSAIGIHMVDPFYSKQFFTSTLIEKSIEWVCNLPSVVQHDKEFLSSLEEVALGFDKEMSRFADLVAQGFKGIAVINTVEQAVQAQCSGASALLIIPDLQHYDKGQPCKEYRQSLIWAINNELDLSHISLLALVSEDEKNKTDCWPEGVHGVVVQPVIKQ